MIGQKIKKDDHDFEIKFYEGILDKNQDFIEVLNALGHLYTNVGLYEKGLIIDKKLERLKPKDPIVLYNLACSYSLLNKLYGAFRCIKKAVKYGYRDFDHLEHDDDLWNLNQDLRFQKFFVVARRKYAS